MLKQNCVYSPADLNPCCIQWTHQFVSAPKVFLSCSLSLSWTCAFLKALVISMNFMIVCILPPNWRSDDTQSFHVFVNYLTKPFLQIYLPLRKHWRSVLGHTHSDHTTWSVSESSCIAACSNHTSWTNCTLRANTLGHHSLRVWHYAVMARQTLKNHEITSYTPQIMFSCPYITQAG